MEGRRIKKGGFWGRQRGSGCEREITGLRDKWIKGRGAGKKARDDRIRAVSEEDERMNRG